MRGVCSRGGGSLRIPFGIRSPRISSKEGPTSELCRNSWARERCDHAALHARLPDAALPGLRAESPEGLTWRRRRRRPPANRPPPKAKAKAPNDNRRITIPPAVDDELGALWDAFKGSASDEAREHLILHYAPLVKYVASRVATGLPASVEQADLVSYGMFGLIDALQKFEPGRGNKFETYAIPRIKGAIIDELRAMDWVPRSVRFKAREIEKAHSDLEAMLKRQPTEEEMAERLGISRSRAARRRHPDLVRLGARAGRAGVGGRATAASRCR